MDEKMIHDEYLQGRELHDQEYEFQKMVHNLVKSPQELMQEVTHIKCALIHAGIGICGEGGEIIDTIKKHVIYNQALNRENLIEELGDLEFYIENLRQIIGISREECIGRNMTKLAKRYPGFVYTDSKAKERLDK